MFQIVSQRSLENHCCWCGDGEMVRGVPGWLVTTAGVESDWSLDWDSWIWVNMHSRVDYKILVLDKHEIYCPLTLNCPHGFKRLKWSLSLHSFQQQYLNSSMSKFGNICESKNCLNFKVPTWHDTTSYILTMNMKHIAVINIFFIILIFSTKIKGRFLSLKMCWCLVDTVF